MKSRVLLGTAIALAVIMSQSASTAPMPQPSFHTKGTPTGKATGPLKPGEYWWSPRVSPAGPVVVLVSLPQQIMNVYRNGILVGRSSISSGSAGHNTPTGVFTILEKKQTHRSKKYDDAPMPNMQRLTWSGIAMHSGNLPGYPASHGCIRMPYDFSTLLFGITGNGGTVVIGDSTKTQPHFAANPGVLLAPKDFTPEMLKPLGSGEYQWHPERSPSGPITMLVSAADRTIYVYRNGEPIGRAAIEVKGRLGGHVFTMLEGTTGRPSRFTPKHEEARWMRVTSEGRPVDVDALASRLHFSPDFADKLANELNPGTSVIVTDYPVVRKPVTQSDVFAAN